MLALNALDNSNIGMKMRECHFCHCNFESHSHSEGIAMNSISISQCSYCLINGIYIGVQLLFRMFLLIKI